MFTIQIVLISTDTIYTDLCFAGKIASSCNRTGGSCASIVWNYFEMDAGRGKVSCRQCKQQLLQPEYQRNAGASETETRIRELDEE